MNKPTTVMNDAPLTGGRRLKVCSEESQSHKPVISIITVVKNRRDTFVNTVRSVLSQTYSNYEYIVIDGLSTDGTLDVIRDNDTNIDYWISEKDEGIYDAMNKGLRVCRGEWMLMLNSDDTLSTNNILADVAEHLARSHADVVHGDINVHYPSGRTRINIPLETKYLKKTMCLNHGGCFINRSIHVRKFYDTSFRFAADYDLLLWAYLNGHKFEYINKTIIEYSAGGVSGTPNYGNLEAYKIWKSYFGRPKASFLYIKDQAPKIIKVPIKKTLIQLGLY